MVRVGLCIGINYTGHEKGVLHGCVNDAKNLQSFLKHRCDFDDVSIMTDEVANKGTAMYPAGQNIIRALYDLAVRTHREQITHLWISYSGHGAQIRDRNRDEADGMDETVLPVDYSSNGVISDDLLLHVLSLVHPSTHCMVLMDCCHSGTILDLQYKLESDSRCSKVSDRTISSNIIMVSGCKDKQVSMDIKGEGAMTRAFLDTVHNFDCNLTLRGLIYGMRLHLVARDLKQVPQVTMSHEHTPSRVLVGTNGKVAFIPAH